MKANQNIAMLEVVAAALGDLCDEVVFIGGATTALYIDDPASPPPAPSDDVDCVVEIATEEAYRKLEAELRKRGFKDPIGDENPPICRKYYDGIQVDVMPTEESILGFSNRWYPEAIEKKESFKLPSGKQIYIFSGPYFLATKLVAYIDRGRNEDPRFSQDLEDICALLEGCTKLRELVAGGSDSVKRFIRSEFSRLLEDESLFEEIARGFIRRHGDPNARAKHIVTTARLICEVL